MRDRKAIPGGVFDLYTRRRILARGGALAGAIREPDAATFGGLEARATEHGPTLPGGEGHRGFSSAGGAGGPRFRVRPRDAAMLRPAGCAAFGLVFELHLLVEDLLPGGKNEFPAAIHTFQRSVAQLHNHLLPIREKAVEGEGAKWFFIPHRPPIGSSCTSIFLGNLCRFVLSCDRGGRSLG